MSYISKVCDLHNEPALITLMAHTLLNEPGSDAARSILSLLVQTEEERKRLKKKKEV